MPSKDEPRCETCGHFNPDSPNRPGAGTCMMDGHIVDTKETCAWHTEKTKEKGS